MSREAELFDGTILEFPDNTPDDVILRTVKTQTALKQSGRPASPNMGYGADPRAAREAIEPVTPDLQREVNIARLMARDRPGTNAGTALQQGFTLGLRDEARGAGAGLANLLKGGSFGAGYDVSREADKRLAAEYAARNPVTAGGAELAGGLLGAGPGLAASGAAAAAPAATSLAGRALEGLTAGGVLGGVQGAANAEGQDRLTQGLTGAAAGGALGAAAPVALDALSALARPLTNFFRSAVNPELEAARRVSATAEADAAAAARGVPSTGLDEAAYQRAINEGQPVALVDRGGEQTRALARSAANVSPEARQTLNAAVDPRYATQTERLDQALARESTETRGPGQLVEDARAAARTANQPAYRTAYELGSGNIWTPALERLTGSSPAMQTALKRAVAKSADANTVEGFGAMSPRVRLSETGDLVFRTEGGLPAYPDLRLWDLTKRELDSLGKQADRSGDDSAARIYKGLSSQLRAELDHLPEVGPAYQAARQTAARFFGEADAFSAGQAFSARGRDMSLDEARRAVAKMSPEESRLFKEGYIAGERERVSKMSDNRDATLQIINSPDAGQRANLALGANGAQRLTAQLEVEQAMMATRRALQGNSTTARQLREMGLASAMGAPAAGVFTGDWSPANLTAGALVGAGARYAKGNVDARLASRIADMLASRDPRAVQRLVSLASRYPAYLNGVRALRLSLVGQLGAEGASAAPAP